MQDQAKLIESLLENATEYGKTSLEIVKLKAVDKSSQVISSLVFQTILFVLVSSFVIFINLGLAIWIGKLLGQLYWGFFVMAAFYLVTGLIYYFLFKEKIKRQISEYVIKQVLN